MTSRDSQAERTFAAWLSAADRSRFEDVLRRHPEQAAELQRLHAAWRRLVPLLERLGQETSLTQLFTPQEAKQLRRLLSLLRQQGNGNGR